MGKSLFMKERGVHPLTTVSLEERVSYLKAIAVFVALEDASKEKFTHIIELLECGDVQEDLFAFLEDVTKEQSVEVFESLEERLRLKVAIEIIYTFRVDITQLEDSFVDDLLKVSREVLSLLYKLITAIKSGNSDTINEIYLEVLEFEGFYEIIGEFTSVYGFEHAHSLQEIVDDFIYAGKNEHETIYQPKYMNTKIVSNRKNIILKLLSKQGLVLGFVDNDLKKDTEVVLTAVKKDGRALAFVDNDLKKDKKIVLTSVKQNGLALKYVDSSLKYDKEILLTAVKQNEFALEFGGGDLKEVVLAAVKQNLLAIDFANDDLKKDKEVQEVLLTIMKQQDEELEAFEYMMQSLIDAQ